ncbi:MAG: GNAT family N-acetyltransferase [Aeromonadaceae bacterium]
MSGSILAVDADLALLHLHSTQAEALFTLIENNRADLTHWLSWPQSIQSVADLQDFIRAALLQLAQRRALQCAIRYQGEMVGMCGFQSLNHGLKQAQVGYWLAKPWQGRGIVTRACHLLLAYGFDVLGMEKMVISTAVANFPSRALCERLGFQQTRVLPQAEQLADRVVDHLLYTLCREQWQGLHHAGLGACPPQLPPALPIQER